MQVLFLAPDSERDFFLNRLTARVGELVHGRGFCHVELKIPHPSCGGYVSTSIYNNETVCMNKSKSFANPGYTVHTFAVSKRQMDDIFRFVQASHDNRVAFDHIGMFCASLPFHVPRLGWKGGDEKTFCSKYVTDALQRGGVECVQGLDSRIVTPSKLYKVLTQNAKAGADVSIIGSVAYKEKSMETRGDFKYMKL